VTPGRFLSQLSPGSLALVAFAAISGSATLTLSFLYVQSVHHKEAEIRRHVHDLAETAAALVDVEPHEALVRPDQAGSAEYRAVLDPLLRFHRGHPAIQYLWTVRVNAAGEQRFMLETATDDGIRTRQRALGRSQDLLPFLGPNTETPAGVRSIAVLRQGTTFVFPEIYTDTHGSYIEARAPLRRHDGQMVGYVGIDYALDSFTAQINEVRLAGAVSLLVALVVGGIAATTAAAMRRQTLRLIEQARQAEAEMRLHRDRAEQASQAKGEFLAIAAHDLKNPLAAVAGMSGLLQQMFRQRAEARILPTDLTALENINSAARHMSEIVRGILMNEGLEHGGLAVSPASTDVCELVRNAIRFNQPAAARKQIAIESDLPAALTAEVDPKLLREGFDNYISNAIKYSPRGTRVTVELKVTAAADLEFAVRDEGPGLSPEDQAKLFEKFTKLTPRPTGGESSTGLGLSIVKVVAQLHHGSVGCETAPGRGARFWLRVPLVPPANTGSA
jgi:signal transduction histidine kinase